MAADIFKPSQAQQDNFAFQISGYSGTYIEIGAASAIRYNNTLKLEREYNWRGISIELNKRWVSSWQVNNRTNKIYFEDAITFDYIKALNECKLPNHINYLSCDIEPPKNTFAALQKVIEQGVTFDVITFEHDTYVSDDKYDIKAREFLAEYDYKVAVYDVYANDKPDALFETWFVNNNIKFKEISFSEWTKENNYGITINC